MKLILYLIGITLLLFLFLNKASKGRVVEVFSILWFRIAFAFVILFGINLIASQFGFFIPINIVSGLLIAFLGVPGIASVITISMFL
ncbi:pro-sigmaK processing inhibitor BofA family protein [Paenisporosarcina sp. TG-14]|uniref:pro-sigmaK processing inhibitor BofA family protein n=1 Tax=Paenisporosarcina sp. TG-14 TaxID=1231057 RepID=UPI0003001828|nr:pro-sigmaK processing inhibitor BofA family protein [Paenisporosarcina sp. TG-14]